MAEFNADKVRAAVALLRQGQAEARKHFIPGFIRKQMQPYQDAVDALLDEVEPLLRR